MSASHQYIPPVLTVNYSVSLAQVSIRVGRVSGLIAVTPTSLVQFYPLIVGEKTK